MVLEGTSVITGAAAAAFDCSVAIDGTCALDVSATIGGAVAPLVRIGISQRVDLGLARWLGITIDDLRYAVTIPPGMGGVGLGFGALLSGLFGPSSP